MFVGRRGAPTPRPTRLPTPLTPLFGRDGELGILEDLVRRAETRLVTLTGPGGVGKTRLAVALAHRLAPAFPDGVFFLDLALMTDSDALIAEIAHALARREQSGRSLVETVTAHLARRQVLLILDNFEHLVRAAPTVSRLLAAAPRLRVLVTSRSPLRLRGEREFPIAPLRLPDEAATTSLDSLAANPALALFAHHARAARPAFSLTTRNAASIVALCRRLDGLPLALELAAAKLRFLSPDDLLRHLDNRFALLTGGARDLPTRQQTLLNTLDWSYDLLSDDERALFVRLSLFAGGCDLQALMAIGDPPVPVDLLSGVESLVSQSLVQAAPSEGGGTRYTLLETIREYGRYRSAEADRLAFSPSHARYYLQLVRQVAPHLRGPEQSLWLARLDADADNIRIALRWALASGQAKEALAALTALTQYWRLRGRRREGALWLDQALDKALPAPAALMAQALYSRGLLAWEVGDHAGALVTFEASLTQAEQEPDPRGIANALAGLGLTAMASGDYARATALYEQSLALRQEVGDRWEIANAHFNLGLAALAGERLDAARVHFGASLAAYQQVGDQAGSAQALLGLGEVARAEGHSADARVHYEQALSLARAVGDEETTAWLLHNLGYVARAEGQAADAARLFRHSLTLFAAKEHPVGMAHGLAGLAAVDLLAGHDRRAAQLLAAAQAGLTRLNARSALPDQHEIGQAIETVRRRLDAASLDAAWRQGQAMPFDAAMGIALAPAAPEATLRVYALGPVQVLRDGQPITARDWRYGKAQELLFFLLSEGPATKEGIGLGLWPDASPAQLRSRFHRTLHHLRQALGGAEWITRQDDRYAFNRSPDTWFDVEEFEATIKDLASGPLPLESPLSTLQSLYRGDFLAGLDAGDWATVQREELRRRYLDALLDAGTRLLAAGEHARAVAVFETVVTHDSYLEAAQRGLMVALARSGERAQALDCYTRLAKVLREELDTEPAPETRDLVERLRRGEPV